MAQLASAMTRPGHQRSADPLEARQVMLTRPTRCLGMRGFRSLQ
jgi:hypothetical protein